MQNDHWELFCFVWSLIGLACWANLTGQLNWWSQFRCMWYNVAAANLSRRGVPIDAAM